MFNKIWKIILYAGYLHEIFHFGAARLMGVEAKIHKTYVEYGHITDRQRMITSLAPFTVFTLLFCTSIIAWAFAVEPEWKRTWFLFSITWFFWMTGCYWDIKKMLNFLRNGKWTW